MASQVLLLLFGLTMAQASPKEWTLRASGVDLAFRNIAEVGDVDGDGVPDVVAGRQDPERDLLNWYDARDTVLCVSGATARVLWRNEGPRYIDCPNTFGEVLTALGDLDADGTRDVAVGVPYTPPSSEGWPFGRSTSRSTVRILSGKDGHLLREHQGIAEGVDGFGVSVIAMGDVDGDGVADYAVGACTVNLSCSPRPNDSVAIFSGRSGSLIARLDASRFDAGKSFGRTLLDAGDLDGDGVPELAVKVDSAVDFGGTWCFISIKERHRLFAIDARIGRIGSDLRAMGDKTADGICDFAVLVVEDAAEGRQLFASLISGKDGTLAKRVELPVPSNSPLLEDHALHHHVWQLALTRAPSDAVPSLSILSWEPSYWFRIDEEWRARPIRLVPNKDGKPLIGHFMGGTSRLTASENFYACFMGPEDSRETFVKRIRL